MFDLGLVSENRDFGILWLSHLVSKFGDGLRFIALPWLVLLLTGSPLQLAISFALNSVPNIILSPFTGYYVDKIDRKKLLVGCSLLQALVILIVPLSNIFGSLNIYLIYLVMVLMSIFSSFFYETRYSLLPNLVGDENLDEANSFIHGTVAFTTIFSFVLGGSLVQFIGINFTFILDSATFLAAAFIVTFAVLPTKESKGPKRLKRLLKDVFHENIDALTEMRGTVIEKLVLFGILINLAMIPFILILPVIGKDIYGSVLVFSALMIAKSSGQLSGNYFVNKIPWERPVKIYTGVMMSAVLTLALGGIGLLVQDFISVYYFPTVVLFVSFIFFIYLTQPLFNVPSDSMVQTEASDEHRGKILSLTNATLNIPFPFAYLLAGVLLSIFSPFLVIFIMGIILIMNAVFETLYFREYQG